MPSVKELIESSTIFLEKRGVPSPRLCAEELLGLTLDQKRADLFLNRDRFLKKEEEERYHQLVRRKGLREPLGYLLKEMEFLGCTLSLSPEVFIPRFETEILLDLALKEIPDQPKTLWDLCTGTGCLGLATKKQRPNLQVTLSDISEHALACAQMNGEKNRLKVDCIKSDLLSEFRGRKADFILCNPPYVSEEEYPYLEREVHFEPRKALVAKNRGLEFYRRLALDLPNFLTDGANIFLEIGQNQGQEVAQIFNQNRWKRKRCKKDWAGKDRFFFLEFCSHPL